MLNAQSLDARSNELLVSLLTDDSSINTTLLGCPSCPHYSVCGGLSIKDSAFDCFDFCCGNPNSCTRMCRNNPTRFVAQAREIGGYRFDHIPRTSARDYQLNDEIVPMIYHGSTRSTPLAGSTFALRLSDLVNFRKGRIRFHSRSELCDAYKINSSSEIILSGVDHDHRIEAWWSLGDKRSKIIESFIDLGIRLVTAPNYSVLLDNPRTDDLYAMSRIAIVFAEFQQVGLACALHPNGRTMRDFERWTDFIVSRPEISALAYEFITGPGSKFRQQFHLDRLADLARAAERKIDIIVRGDPNVIPFLRKHFYRVIYIDTTAFMKTIHRQRAERAANDLLHWSSAPTVIGDTVDTLMKNNIDEQLAFLRATYFGNDLSLSKAA
jgi:hypothetical protein